MKLKLSIFALLALLVVGCTDDNNLPEPDENEVSENEVRMVTISASMSPETRVSYTDDPISVAWEADDQLMLVGFDDGNVYKGKSIFSKSVTGNTFSGYTVAGATKYKAYYPADAVQMDPLNPDKVLLDSDGNVPVPGYEFWEQTQTASGNTAHINKHLFMSDEDANALNVPFQMVAKSSILKLTLENIPDMTLTKILWKTEESLNGYTHWAALNVTPTTITQTNNSYTAYLAFPPCDMVLGAGGRVKVMLIGLAKSYEWVSGQISAGKTYLPGKRYTATVNMGWSTAKTEFTFAINPNKNTNYQIKLKETTTTVPADLTIYWGEGQPQTISANTQITNGILASHYYDTKGERIITIYSAQGEPTLKQMPQLTFQDDNWLTAVLTPFPNFGPTATDFSWCFSSCENLTHIPAGLFHNNTLINDFEGCCYHCTYLYIKPGLFPAEGSNFFANRGDMNWSNCFNKVGEKLANAGTAPPLWTYGRGGNKWTYTDCFKGAIRLTNYSSIPASWGGGGQ
ncbi:MAG: fimbrillin family protein [Fermentimonas sp.]|jgi:hypothetical protein